MIGHHETHDALDTAPGVASESHHDILGSVRSYAIGLALSAFLTAAAFYFARSPFLWEPSIPVALGVLAVAQIGVHLVFFVHLTSAADNVNNTLALAFGTLIVGLLIVGTLWIMQHFDHNLGPMHTMGASAKVGTIEGVVGPTAVTSVEARVEGNIVSVNCAQGSRVGQGDVCARLERTEIDREIEQSSAQVTVAQATFKADSERLTALKPTSSKAKGRSKSQITPEALRALVAKDEERIAAARAALESAKAKLALTDIVTPIGGLVAAQNVEPGQHVVPGQQPPPFVIEADRERVDVTVTVDSDAANAFPAGSHVIATRPAHNSRQFSGVVVSVSTASPDMQGIELHVSIADPEGALRPGERVLLTPHMP